MWYQYTQVFNSYRLLLFIYTLSKINSLNNENKKHIQIDENYIIASNRQFLLNFTGYISKYHFNKLKIKISVYRFWFTIRNLCMINMSSPLNLIESSYKSLSKWDFAATDRKKFNPETIEINVLCQIFLLSS